VVFVVAICFVNNMIISDYYWHFSYWCIIRICVMLWLP